MKLVKNLCYGVTFFEVQFKSKNVVSSFTNSVQEIITITLAFMGTKLFPIVKLIIFKYLL